METPDTHLPTWERFYEVMEEFMTGNGNPLDQRVWELLKAEVEPLFGGNKNRLEEGQISELFGLLNYYLMKDLLRCGVKGEFNGINITRIMAGIVEAFPDETRDYMTFLLIGISEVDQHMIDWRADERLATMDEVEVANLVMLTRDRAVLPEGADREDVAKAILRTQEKWEDLRGDLPSLSEAFGPAGLLAISSDGRL